MATSQLLDLARKYRAQLEAQDEAALQRLVRAYALMYSRLEGKVDALLLEIERDGVGASGVAKLARYKSLMRQIDEEVSQYAAYLKTEIGMSTDAAVQSGLKHSYQLAMELVKEAGISATMQTLPTNAIKTLLGFLSEGSPLYDRIGELAGVQAGRVRDVLLEGLGLGYGPRKTASMIQDAFGQGLTDALRMTRTADLWSYREAARANYNANSDIVSGWTWTAEKDGDTCAACLAEDGGIHGLDEQLDGHFNCRCAALPYVEGLSEIPQSGSDWFDVQTEDTQRGILGAGKYEAWKSGKFSLSDVVDRAENDTYGQMVREKSLKELVGE